MVKKNVFKSLSLYIIFIGILARFAWILYMNTYPETDFMWYHVKGVELSKGLGFLNGIYPLYTGKIGMPTAFRPIGYPLVLAMLYKVFGTSFWVGKIFNIFLSTVTMVYLYKLCKMFFSETISNVALCLFAFSPLAICYTSILGSETLFQTLLILALYSYFSDHSPYILGIWVGLLALVRPIGIFFGLIFIALLFIQRKLFTKDGLKFALLFCATFLVVISGWLVRNYIHFGEFIYSTNGGYVLYVNNNPNATGSWSDPFSYPDSPFKEYLHEDSFDEIAINKVGKKLAMDFILENPTQFINLAFKRMANSYWNKLDDVMWAFTTGVNEWDSRYVDAIRLETNIYRIFYILTFIYIIYAIYDLTKPSKSIIHTLILLVFLYFNAMMFILEGNSRYVFPLHPIYSIGVSFVLCNVFLPFAQKTKEKAPFRS